MKRPLSVLFVLTLLGLSLLGTVALLLQPWSAPTPRPSEPAATSGAANVATAPPSDVPLPAVRDAAQTIAPSVPRGKPVLRGRLLQDRQPLAGVTVCAAVIRSPAADEVARTTTAPDGSFELAAAEQTLRLFAHGPTVPRGWRSDWIQPSPIDRDLGDVHVPRGAPVAGAEVTIQDGVIGVSGPGEVPEVRTDAHGVFRVELVHPGDHRVHVRADRYASGNADVAAVEGEVANVVVQLTRGGRVTGVVRNWRGEPLGGAVVESDGVRTQTSADGAFVLEPFGGEDVTITAERHDTRYVHGFMVRNPLLVQLDRLVRLDGVVRGHDGTPMTVRIEPDHAGDGLLEPGPWSVLGKDLSVDADGTFSVPGLRPADYVVHASSHGVRVASPTRVRLRDDAKVELQVDAEATFVVSVRDENGQPVLGAEAVLAADVAEYPSLFVDGDPALVSRLRSVGRRTKVPFDGASVTLRRIHPIAFAVHARGHLTVARAFVTEPPPERLELVLRRAGSVQGIVRGGSGVAYTRTVSIWRAEDDAKMRAPRPVALFAERFEPTSCQIDAGGTFAAQALAPGEYRAAVARTGRARTSQRPDEQIDAVPLVDDAEDLRAVVAFTVEPGAETRVEIDEPGLGTLRGRVLLAGRPFAGATIVAARPGARRISLSDDEPADWDDAFQLGWTSGQHSRADGTFTFLYRDAGAIELRVRHTNGDATSAPTILHLPPPGTDVLCDVTIPGGGIRGRFPIELIPDDQRKHVEILLLPMHKAAADPFASSDSVNAIAWSCAKREPGADGVFAFQWLPPGDWLVRVCKPGFAFSSAAVVTDSVIHCQRVIPVPDAVVDLGEVSLPRPATATFAWRWQDDGMRERVSGVGLFQAHGRDAAAVWVASFWPGAGQHTAIVPAGDYVLAPFAWRERTGDGVAVRVGADGTVTPAVVTLAAPTQPR